MDMIIGKTPVKIDCGDTVIEFTFSDGSTCKWFHEQDCCESVTVEDVNGDWLDLIGVPLLVADERSSTAPAPSEWDSATWTFYTFRSIKGSVDVRWLGESNGYYSESVDFEFTERAP